MSVSVSVDAVVTAVVTIILTKRIYLIIYIQYTIDLREEHDHCSSSSAAYDKVYGSGSNGSGRGVVIRPDYVESDPKRASIIKKLKADQTMDLPGK